MKRLPAGLTGQVAIQGLHNLPRGGSGGEGGGVLPARDERGGVRWSRYRYANCAQQVLSIGEFDTG